MSKFSKASDEIQKLVNEIAGELYLSTSVDFEAVCVAKAKEVVEVRKASAVAEYLSNREDLVLVMVFEEAFDALGFDEQAQKDKYMWLRMAMTQVIVDEKGKVNIGVPSVTIPVEFYDKFKGAAVDSALLAKHTIAQLEEKHREEKEKEKADKASRKKFGNKQF